MGAVAIAPSTASPYSAYVQELQGLFASAGLSYGAPADIFALVERMHQPGDFPAELSSIVGSIAQREGGSVPHAQLMEIVALAISGPEIERAPQQYQQPLRQLLSFLTGVLNQRSSTAPAPPGSPSLVVPFPREDHTAVAPDPAAVAGPAPELEVDAPPIEPAAAAGAAPPPLSTSIPRLSLAAYLPRRLSPSAVRGVLLAGACLFLLAESLFIYQHREVFASLASAPRPAAAPPAAPVATSPAPQYTAVSAPAALDTAAPDAGTPAAAPSKPSAYGEAFTPQPAPPTSQRRSAADDSDSDPSSDDVAPPRVLQAYAKPSAPAAPSSVAPPENPPAQPVPPPAAAPIVREPPAAPAPALVARRDPDDRIVGDPRPVRPEPNPNAPHFDISSGLMNANLVFAPRPEYPALARLAHAQGQVVMQAVVSRDGSVSAIRVLSGNHLLRGAATAAVRRWRYRPYLADGRPIDISTIVTIGFHAN